MRLSMTVPLYFSSKQDKAVNQRSYELMQKKYALQDEWNQVREDISKAVSDFRRSKNQTVLFKSGIIPQARQTVASMLSGYQVDKVDFLNLVRSQITLYNYEIQYWKVLTEANQALAQLTAMIGKEGIYRNAEQIIHDSSATTKRKCDFRFAHKINGLSPSISATHPCAAGIANKSVIPHE